MILLDSLAGSHLYGLADAQSDLDRYVVCVESRRDPNRYRHSQRVSDEDRIRVSLSGFLVQCERGSHQALDAMFAPPAACEVDKIAELRRGYRAGITTIHALLRVVKKFAHMEGEDRFALKRRRHAVRIAFQIGQLVESGRYDPRLPDSILEVVKSAWEMPAGEIPALCQRVCPIDLGIGDTSA